MARPATRRGHRSFKLPVAIAAIAVLCIIIEVADIRSLRDELSLLTKTDDIDRAIKEELDQKHLVKGTRPKTNISSITTKTLRAAKQADPSRGHLIADRATKKSRLEQIAGSGQVHFASARHESGTNIPAVLSNSTSDRTARLSQGLTSFPALGRNDDHRARNGIVSTAAFTRPLTNTTSGDNRHTPVPHESQKTFYVMKSRNNAAIAQLLEANPAYRQVEVAKEASIVWTKMVNSEPMLRLVLGKGALSFREVQPWQRINHLRNERPLDDKEMFLAEMRNYVKRSSPTMETRTAAWFVPESYRLHMEEEREEFVRRLDPNIGGGIDEAWVWKDPTAERGQGVVMLGPRSDRLKELQTKLIATHANGAVGVPGTGAPLLSWNNSTEKSAKRTIVQNYIPSIQWEGRKLDLRVYVLVVSIEPLLVYYHDGIVRVSSAKYDPTDFNDQSIASHLTIFIGNGSNADEQDLNLAQRSFDDLGHLLRQYVTSKPRRLSRLAAHIIKDPLTHVRQRMKDALGIVVDAFRETVFNPEGCVADNCYALFGADFMIDTDLNVWITEMNDIPDMSVKSKAKKEVFDTFAPQMFEMIEEVRDKQARGSATAHLLPLTSARTWELVYDQGVSFKRSTLQQSPRKYARCVPSSPTNRTRARAISPVPDESKMTAYSSSVVFKGPLSNIGHLLEVQPGYRRVEVAKTASLVWTKKMADNDMMLKLVLGKGKLSYSDIQPWQRVNHLRLEKAMDNKDSFTGRIREHECPPGTKVWFLPETYRLHTSTETDRFLQRLVDGGIDEAWVWKDPMLDRGEGVVMLGAQSNRLKELQLTLQNAGTENISPLSWSNKTSALENMIVQKYIPTALWDGHKFDLRVYWLVASVDPLLVYYHDGIVRVALTKYDADDFSSKSHLTNVAQSVSTKGDQNITKDLVTRSFDDFDLFLRQYIKTEAPPNIDARAKEEPLSYIRTEMKNALAFVVDAFRKDVFNPGNLPADNGYALFGADFLIDTDLNVWITEVQYGPTEAAEAKAKRDTLDLMVPQMFRMVEEIRAKQDTNTEILSLESAETWELLYG